ncbi:hypothetical protein GOODEAATRI_031989, partial [Goodea atripinnis]
ARPDPVVLQDYKVSKVLPVLRAHQDQWENRDLLDVAERLDRRCLTPFQWANQEIQVFQELQDHRDPEERRYEMPACLDWMMQIWCKGRADPREIRSSDCFITLKT